jgi:spoIIIJ-associated protein
VRSVEAEGETIDAAIDAALSSLGASRDQVEVAILSNATRGLFGIGGRKARVRATLRRPISEQLLEDASDPLDVYVESSGRGDQEASPQDVRAGENSARAGSRLSSPPRRVVDATIAQDAAVILRTIVGHMGVAADVGVRTEPDAVILELSGDSSGVLIGRKGQMLDALEYLVSRIVSRDQTTTVHVTIDCEGYRLRRREGLEELARRMADEAKRKRRVITLNAMSPRDRRIVHLVLQQDPGISTRSSGKGLFRRLVIVPRDVGDSSE